MIFFRIKEGVEVDITKKEALAKLETSEILTRKPVGIKFLFTKEEYEGCPVEEARAKMAYCVMVKTASLGVCMKTDITKCICGGGTRAVGLEQPSERYFTGCEAYSFGLYRDLAVAKQEVNSLTFCRHHTHGLLIQPLEAYEDCDPDVVILFSDSFGTMRLIQGYTYHYGPQPNFKMTGNQALCSECTAYPYETNSMNISMFCSGTRYLAGWKDTEIGVGMPYGIFKGVCDGLYLSANGVEKDSRKAMLRENLKKAGLKDPGLEDGKAYYMN